MADLINDENLPTIVVKESASAGQTETVAMADLNEEQLKAVSRRFDAPPSLPPPPPLLSPPHIKQIKDKPLKKTSEKEVEKAPTTTVPGEKESESGVERKSLSPAKNVVTGDKVVEKRGPKLNDETEKQKSRRQTDDRDDERRREDRWSGRARSPEHYSSMRYPENTSPTTASKHSHSHHSKTHADKHKLGKESKENVTATKELSEKTAKTSKWEQDVEFSEEKAVDPIGKPEKHRSNCFVLL